MLSDMDLGSLAWLDEMGVLRAAEDDGLEHCDHGHTVDGCTQVLDACAYHSARWAAAT